MATPSRRGAIGPAGSRATAGSVAEEQPSAASESVVSRFTKEAKACVEGDDADELRRLLKRHPECASVTVRARGLACALSFLPS